MPDFVADFVLVFAVAEAAAGFASVFLPAVLLAARDFAVTSFASRSIVTFFLAARARDCALCPVREPVAFEVRERAPVLFELCVFRGLLPSPLDVIIPTLCFLWPRWKSSTKQLQFQQVFT